MFDAHLYVVAAAGGHHGAAWYAGGGGHGGHDGAGDRRNWRRRVVRVSRVTDMLTRMAVDRILRTVVVVVHGHRRRGRVYDTGVGRRQDDRQNRAPVRAGLHLDVCRSYAAQPGVGLLHGGVATDLGLTVNTVDGFAGRGRNYSPFRVPRGGDGAGAAEHTDALRGAVNVEEGPQP